MKLERGGQGIKKATDQIHLVRDIKKYVHLHQNNLRKNHFIFILDDGAGEETLTLDLFLGKEAL